MPWAEFSRLHPLCCPVVQLLLSAARCSLFLSVEMTDHTEPPPTRDSYRLYKESMGVGLSDNDMMQYVYVKFIGTHAEYDRVDAAVVDQFKGV